MCIRDSPGETIDLKDVQPQMFAELIRDYDDYTNKFGVMEMGINYQPLDEIQNKFVAKLGKAVRPWLFGFVVLIGGFVFWRRRKKQQMVG